VEDSWGYNNYNNYNYNDTIPPLPPQQTLLCYFMLFEKTQFVTLALFKNTFNK